MIHENRQDEMTSIKLVELGITEYLLTDAPFGVIVKAKEDSYNHHDFKDLLVELGYSIKPYLPQLTIDFDD